MTGGRDGGRRGGRSGGGRGSNENQRRGGRQIRGRGSYRGRGCETQDMGARGGRTGGYHLPQFPINPSNVQFIRSVLKNCPNHKLMTTIEQMDKAWLSCWQCVDNLPPDALKVLLSALSRLPFSVPVAPPPLPAISKAVNILLNCLTQYGRGEDTFDGNDGTLEGVELVERIVTRLLKFTWDLKKDDVKNALDEMIANADANLNIRLTTHRPVRSRLTTLLSEMEKSWTIKVKKREATEIQRRGDIPDWRHPTVAWLADYKHFQPALLPKLQLSRTNEGRVYESSDEYFMTIVQLWIGMTFVEGNNALLPHCTVNVGDKMCNQPLWPFPNKNIAINCRNSQCGGYATFVCAHSQHAKGFCSKCASDYQQRLRGPPSKYASSHIYDGFVTQVKHDGTMAIEQVASRRPPLTIHWKTTKRLSSPNLIGIVRLGNREASLRATDDIYWAEIIFQGKSVDEFKARERGCLMLRLLQYLDEPGNALLTHNPAAGDAVAIIDCQTFVPEFIPVLKALEKQRQMPMPFQNGALLNLCDHVSFGPNTDSAKANDDSGSDSNASYPTMEVTEVSTHVMIQKVIQSSLLDPIVDIRRDESLCCGLEKSLLHLVNSATLDPGQLKSFAEALIYPVHCTQGPPGTGKSYLGVVVVRALLVIRDVWKLKNREIGDPPILVLSYKNHAIDEFLLDLLRSEPTLEHNTGSRKNKAAYFGRYYLSNGFKKLVRIGGGCSEPELDPYRERNVAFNHPRVRNVSQQIDDCQGLRDQWHKFRDCFAQIYEAQQIVGQSTESLGTDERKIIQKAVPVMSSAVATLLKLTENLKTRDVVVEGSGEKSDDENDDGKSGSFEGGTLLEFLEQVLKRKPIMANADMVDLHNGIKHYNPVIDPMEMLYQWILGFCPLPVCAYADSCLNVSFEGSIFCREHSCVFTQDSKQFCFGRVVHNRLFCKQHLCLAEMCKNCRMDDTQFFCDDHACFVCLAKDEVAELAVQEPPRNTCDRHPLCWGLEGLCTEVAEPGASYCKMHAEDLYCKWERPCSEIATTGQYCGRHYADAIALAQASSKNCAALTRKRKVCKGKPLSGSSFCRDHVGRSDNLFSTDTAPPKALVHEEGHTNEEKAVIVPSLNGQSPQQANEAAADEKIDDLFSSDSDEAQFEDAVEFDNGDEVEESEHLQHLRDNGDEVGESDHLQHLRDNGNEVGESEHLQHLRDVYEVETDDVLDQIDVAEEIVEGTVPWGSTDQQLTEPHLWHWNMLLEERWNALFSVLSVWNDVNTRLQREFAKQIEDLKIELQREILRANSRVYEGKSVIGGTITSCVSRLEAIRTTNPFAVLVEEASEVMEPLLVSCFSSSTRKLEMIGDHLQLQPSVMGKIDFERVNKINISMFERLISAPLGNQVPSSVLSIQRRMRKSICDLTRSFYDEITTIEDHEVCGIKVLGGAKRKSGMVPLLDACEGGGREVPGVLPHIFFWTHSGRQERAAFGVSRVNHREANMTCKLVQYLVHCGVPVTSIAVLTPYKGQLMLMRKELMSTYGLKMMTKERDSRPVPSCTVSTIDRFQGDEADIVIISLVIDGKSRTPFVKLQNRMIVLLSRARLGLYVVGNVEYFGETIHWQKTLGLLEKNAESDNTKNGVCTTYEGPQIGAALPICCPEHRTSVALAKGECDLKLGFCTVVCSVKLSCSHPCGLLCHWPQVTIHNKNCTVEVESPCTLHPRILKCSKVTTSAEKGINEALRKYKCDCLVDVTLPCGHNQKMTCYAQTEIENGNSSWPVCHKKAIAPYVYSECKHIQTCTCSEFDWYTKGRAPPCSEIVEYMPPCQHIVTQLCHNRQNYISGMRRYMCQEKVTVSLPRCGHQTDVSCPTAESLQQWTGECCSTLNFVQEGTSYGPKDYFCKQTVKFQRCCGHYEMVRCERAFELAQSPSRCLKSIVEANPECGHECTMTCFERKRLWEKIEQLSTQPHDVTPIKCVQESDASNYRNYGLKLQCNEEVTFIRACGHKSKMKCSEARHATTACGDLVTAAMPLCGHTVQLPCHISKHLDEWHPWRAPMPSIHLLLNESILEDTLKDPAPCPAALRSILNKCTASVRFRRATTCGHDVEMKCRDAFELLQSSARIPCTVRVLKQLKCGHEVAMKCCDKIDTVVCQKSIKTLCWNFAACGSSVEMPCSALASTVHCSTKTAWHCPQGHSFMLQLCSKGYPSECPFCSSDRLKSVVKETHRLLSDQNLTFWSPESARIFPDMGGVAHITMSVSSKRDFLVRKVKLLKKFKDSIGSGNEWSSPLFVPLEILVFAVLNRKLQGRNIDKFEMHDFGNQTFLGIEAYEATQENFKEVVNESNVSVVFGQLYTAKSLSNPTDIPQNKGKKGSNIRSWISRQSSHGYDAMYRDSKTGKKGGTFIVWHPYALFPLHLVEITDANRQGILKYLPETSQISLRPRKILFEKPSGGTGDEEKVSSAQAPCALVDADIVKLRELAAALSPLFEKLNIWYPWDGKTLSTGAAEAIPHRMEKTLASKLAFIPLQLVNKSQQPVKTPFGGVKYVRNLQSQGKLREDGDLFLALELLAVRKQDTSETHLKLEEYVTRISGEECGYAHPLVIIALARLAARSSQAQASEIQRQLLQTFTTLYPEASSLWLSKEETQLMQTPSTTAIASDHIISGFALVEDKWESLRCQFGCRSQAMEDLLKLVGLKKVKDTAVNLFKNAMVLQQLSATQRKKNAMAFNFCFVGNPGTGKTTVARLFASVLKDSGIRKSNTLVECTAQQLKDDGAAEFRKLLQKATNGVLFIDEAYELDPVNDFKGKPIVAELLTAAEDKRGELSIILAGYQDDIYKKLYAYNDGLSSRFEEVVFEDYDAQELNALWDGKAQDCGWEYEQAIAKVACRRLAKAAGRKGFGNARAVRKLFEQAVKQAMAREDFDGNLKFQTVDLLGDRPSNNLKLQVVLSEVEEKTGWKRVKEELKRLVRISDENYERELKGLETVQVFLNRLFLGNPGTGKTTCAEYYGRILKALHFLSNGEVVKKTAGDFVGSHVGESQTKTVQILDMAKGKVLVIDEAYNLNDNMFGKQVLDVLVEKVQGSDRDDIAVLLIGYEHEMLEMLRTQNPGLSRRFPLQYAFHFEDYTEHELLDIVEWICAKRSVRCPFEVAEALLKQLALQKTQPHFGNAGAVEQLLKHALGKAMSRPMVSGMTVLTLEDVSADTSEKVKDPIKLLDRLYRMDEIKEQLTQLRNQMIVADREGSGLPEIGHFVFRGSPGTGKTTVARVMAEILHGMGVLASTKLVETSGLDLTGQYVGQTKEKVTTKLGDAKGGLLFIDEAYELGKGVYGEEAMTTLVAAMTDPSYAGMVIIIAGYPKDMDQMLDRNVGLKSRFTRFIDFPDWEAQDAVVFLSGKAECENFEVESKAMVSLQKTFVELKTLGNFGNGRDAMRVWKSLLQCRSQRVVDAPEEERTITVNDADQAGEAILIARRGGGAPGKGVASEKNPLKLLDDLYRMDQIRDQLNRLQMEMVVAAREDSARPEIGHFVFRGSPGTGKTTVARVMAQILHAMRALATTKFVETCGLDLTGDYVGQTKTKVTEKLVEAKGGLLFIDEAYELGKGTYGEEAMTTLVAAMTNPIYASLVIVIAGYPKDMDVMLNRNAGLKSRFTRFIEFPDWEPEDGVAFLKGKADKEGVKLGHGADSVIYQLFSELKRLDGFGNGRDAIRVWKELRQCRSQRVFDLPEEVRTITADDAAMASNRVLAARRPPDGPVLSQSSVPSDTSVFQTQDDQALQTQLPLSELSEWQEPEEVLLQEKREQEEAPPAAMEEIAEVGAVEENEVEADDSIERDPGVSDQVWEELKLAKEAHVAHLEALKQARDHARQEDERRRAQAKLEEEQRRAAAIQEKIRQICPCPAGFQWFQAGSGWRCGGGGHFVSNAQLNSQFTR